MEKYTDKDKKKIMKLTEKIYKVLDKSDAETTITALNIIITNIVAEVAGNKEEADLVINEIANRSKTTLQAMHAIGVISWKDPPTIN